ncbi:hypothetical protein [Blastococcus xanthinilyticus]|nr:hypothetical protein [Blastococcus xanthinilyticus]
MLRWLCALVCGGVLSGFAFLLVTGEYANEGPILLTVSRNHGLHAGDLFVLAGWAVAVLAVLALAALPPRRPVPERLPERAPERLPEH